jgi:hypothetical protein
MTQKAPGRSWFFLLVVLTLCLQACNTSQVSTSRPGTGQQPGAQGEPPEDQIKSGELVKIEDIQVNITESTPLQVNVTLKGNLKNGCSQITNISPVRHNNTFEITFYSVPIEGIDCTDSPQAPFQETIPLDVDGLPAGTYTVEAYGNSQIFTLSQEIILSSEPVCPAPGMGTQQFSEDDPIQGIGYCFLFPTNFTAVPPSTPGIRIVAGPSYSNGPEPVQATLTITTSDPAGKSLADFIASQIASAGQGSDITQNNVSLGDSIQAIQVEGLPGQTGKRILFTENENLIYTLTFAPTDEDYPQAKSDMENLFNTVVASWAFQP